MSTDSRRCPRCQRTVIDGLSPSSGPRRECPHCGAGLSNPQDEVNPYAAPASYESAGRGGSSPLEVPGSLLGKFAMAFLLFVQILPVIVGLVLVIWLPVRLVSNSFINMNGDDENPMRGMWLNILVEAFFTPPYVAGVLFALSWRMTGERVMFWRAVGHGLSRWGRLFGARFFAFMYILGGFIAFIIPGIILMVRYALVDQVAVLEPATTRPRLRSAELVRGRAWEILGASLLFHVVFIPLAIGLALIPALGESLDNLWGESLIDCVVDVLSAYLTIVFFL